MKRLKIGLALAALLLVPTLALAQGRTYEIDPAHSQVAFSVRHFVSQVPGRFTDFGGTIQYDPKNPGASKVDVTVQAKSINTDNAKRDDHLRSADFFAVDQFPTLTFKSKSVRATSPVGTNPMRLAVVGDLTIHGVTKQVTVPVLVNGPLQTGAGLLLGADTEFTINRQDYKVTWNRNMDQGGAVLGDEVTIKLNFEAKAK